MLQEEIQNKFKGTGFLNDELTKRTKLAQNPEIIVSTPARIIHHFNVLKLKLLKGKSIVFVNDIDRCYRVKLFLEQFGIRSCVLNAELPLNSRYSNNTLILI